MAEKEQGNGAQQLARGTVARGRTVRVPHPTETVVVGTNPETGKPIRAPKMISFGPFQEVTLPADEVKQLRGLGFLIDPERVEPPPPSEGSHFSETAA